ncbi:oligosaccharide flippase family protein [Bizionia saleffrena]|uniref:Oligosaccharide flippase family protein n=1 Tax=Bizionia saleffrena TaxID=291189 RepID=A0A8H2LAD0_9FLAO|nr:oligosaccharide flippase family protein [Bizionia saleffrena]TYB69456.1 oligosaccharide flippase family protein [Bizionia saleffrena]
MDKKQIFKLLVDSSIGKNIYNSPKALELFKGSFWSILGAVFSKGLVFLSWIIVARILGSEGYGQFGIVRSTVLMFTSFAGFSLGITASKHVAEFLNTDKEKTGRILGLTMSFGFFMGIIVGVLFYLLAPWLATETLNAPEITNELRIGALILFFSALNGAQMGALQGFMSFKRIAKISAIQAVFSFPLFIVGALYFGIYGTIWAFAFSYIIICFLSNFAINKEAKKHKVKVDYSNAWQEKSMLFTYSLPAFLSGLMVMPVKWYADSLLVSRGGFDGMGLFTAALTFNNIILVGAGMLSAPFIAIMAKNKSDDRNSRFSKFNILAPWAIGVFICVPLIVFPEIGSTLFGDTFANTQFKVTFIFVLLFTIVLMFKQGLARIIAVYNLQWWGFLDNMIWGGLLISSFLMLPNQNAVYLALSYLLAYSINTIIIIPLYFSKKLIPEKTIISLESCLIWLIITGVAFVGVYIEQILIRMIILIIALVLFIFSFYRLFNESSKNNL